MIKLLNFKKIIKLLHVINFFIFFISILYYNSLIILFIFFYIAQLRKEKYNIIEKFVRTFVPPDVTEDDISHFTTNLCDDEVSNYFF